MNGGELAGAGPPVSAEEAQAAAREYWSLEALRSEQTAAEVAAWMNPRAGSRARKAPGKPTLASVSLATK
jgi:hypothetical protein